MAHTEMSLERHTDVEDLAHLEHDADSLERLDGKAVEFRSIAQVPGSSILTTPQGELSCERAGVPARYCPCTQWQTIVQDARGTEQMQPYQSLFKDIWQVVNLDTVLAETSALGEASGNPLHADAFANLQKSKRHFEDACRTLDLAGIRSLRKVSQKTKDGHELISCSLKWEGSQLSDPSSPTGTWIAYYDSSDPDCKHMTEMQTLYRSDPMKPDQNRPGCDNYRH